MAVMFLFRYNKVVKKLGIALTSYQTGIFPSWERETFLSKHFQRSLILLNIIICYDWNHKVAFR